MALGELSIPAGSVTRSADRPRRRGGSARLPKLDLDILDAVEVQEGGPGLPGDAVALPCGECGEGQKKDSPVSLEPQITDPLQFHQAAATAGILDRCECSERLIGSGHSAERIKGGGS